MDLIIFICLFALIICLANTLLFPGQAIYFRKGSEQELLLLAAIQEYVCEYYQPLCCSDLELMEEYRICRFKYDVMIKFNCKDTCKANGEVFAFKVDTSQYIVSVIEPCNPEQLVKYKNLQE